MPSDIYTQWLDDKNQKWEALENILKNNFGTDMKAYPVSKKVNSPLNNGLKSV